MSIGTPIEIFASGTTAETQGTGPCIVGAGAGASKGASTQQMGGLVGGAGSIGGTSKRHGTSQIVGLHGHSDPPTMPLLSSPLCPHPRGIHPLYYQSTC